MPRCLPALISVFTICFLSACGGNVGDKDPDTVVAGRETTQATTAAGKTAATPGQSADSANSVIRESGGASAADGDDFPQPVNTQAAGEHPPSPEEMVELIKVPEGFQVNLFAGEPDVRQPIAFDFDDRGRIWVAENYSYGAHGKYDPALRDRVIILDDTNGDGRFDQRKVFWDKGWMLTGLVSGYGGLWILNDGTLSFVPDKNGDDVPDSEPIVMLNGWSKNAGHNFVNGLMWGPDGWLYGRHGILDTSLPGRPDMPERERQPLNCGIWRFHPVRHDFEVVCTGTTNPWGLDYNADGQFFMTNNVIGHLWHVIPGAHYERMYGQDFNSHYFELMSQTADHYHWDHNGKWTASRDGAANSLGGGHSHCGGMIYQGGHWPEKYHDLIYMCNTHGRRVNSDHLVRAGSGYVAKHGPDFLEVGSPWFRGVELKYGPDGNVYLTDWADNGECHDHDGVHRTSGRIYRIAYSAKAPQKKIDLVTLSATQLADLATAGPDNNNEWYRRRARRILTEQFSAQPFPADLMQLLESRLQSDNERVVLNTAWLLGATNSLNAKLCRQLFQSPNEHVRAFVVQHISRTKTLSQELAKDLAKWVQVEESAFVGLAFASAVQRLPHETATEAGPQILTGLTAGTPLAAKLAADRNLRLMTWYGLLHTDLKRSKPGVIQNENLREFSLRHRASDWDANGEKLSEDFQKTLADGSTTQNASHATIWLKAVLKAVQGRSKLKQAGSWPQISRQLKSLNNTEINQLAAELSALFGSGRALADLRSLIKNRNGDHPAREAAIMTLAQSGDKESVPILLNLLNDRAVQGTVLKALAAFADDRIPPQIIRRWNNFRHQVKDTAIDTMCSRQTFATELLRAIASDRIPASDLTAAHVRQLGSFNSSAFDKIVRSKWGILQATPADRQKLMDQWKTKLTTETLANANREQGAATFKKICSSCHRMYGDGGTIGPDLTGSNRDNLDYLLSNIIAPSAVVPKQFTTSVIVLDDGRVITGVVLNDAGGRITIQTDKDQIVIDANDVDTRRETGKSLMPDGLLESLNETQVRDLFGFLMQRTRR